MTRQRRILCVVGARPNFMKIAPLMRALGTHRSLATALVNTGQHYDHDMSKVFLDELGMRAPEYDLNVGSGTHAAQTARVMVRFERTCRDFLPDAVVVVGDVNSTLACTLVAAKLRIPVAHVEAGLRSGDVLMPEEVNRLATDVLSRWLFTPDRGASANLAHEGIPRKRVHFVGNVMIDNLKHQWPSIERSRIVQMLQLERNGVIAKYSVATLHRPSNVDDPARCSMIVSRLERIQNHFRVVLPLHPRTKVQLRRHGLLRRLRGLPDVHVVDPMGYVDFVALCRKAQFVLTDSGGIQEETTQMGVPCLTLRPNTERPITVTVGTNQLVTLRSVSSAIDCIARGEWKRGRIPERWDGRAADRIAAVLAAEVPLRAD